jgi:hypothetical protein
MINLKVRYDELKQRNKFLNVRGGLTFSVWNVSHMNPPSEWQHVMLAHGMDTDVLDNYNFLVTVFGEHGIVEYFLCRKGIARRHEEERLSPPLGSFE